MEINIHSEPEPRKIKTYGLVSHHFEYTQTNYKEMNRILLISEGATETVALTEKKNPKVSKRFQEEEGR